MNIEEQKKKEKVGRMFNSIAPKYDFLNHLLSFGIDFIWRKKLIRMMKKQNPQKVLDIACGTADLSIAAVRKGIPKVIGADISPGMLLVGNNKIRRLNLENRIELVESAAEELSFEDDTFDAVSVAFGVRNYANLELGLKQSNRVLKQGGKLFVLEFSQPTAFPIKQLYKFYSFTIMPFLGRLISKDKEAYNYLPETAAKFPAGEKFLNIMKSQGFKNLEQKRLSFGIASIYIGEK